MSDKNQKPVKDESGKVPDETRPETPPWKRLLMFWGFAFMMLFGMTYQTLEFLSVPLDRHVVHFETRYYFDYLIIIALSAITVGGVFFGLHRCLASRYPTAWKVIAGLAVGLVVGAVAVYRAALGASELIGQAQFVWVLRNQDYFALGSALLVGFTPPLRRIVTKLAVVAAKVLSPLPFVMGFYFASLPQHETRYEDLPPPVEQVAPPAPVLVLVCDALDREWVFENPEVMDRLPVLQFSRDHFTYFAQSRTAGFHTRHAMPGILFQQRVTEEQYVDATERGENPLAQSSTLFELVHREGDVSVISGYHVLYGKLLGDRADCIRSRPLTYPKHYNFWWRARAQTRIIAGIDYIPFLSETTESLEYWDKYSAATGLEIQSDAVESIERYGGNLVGVFHFAWPHPPFIWNRDGQIEEGGDYFLNAEWTDAKIGELFDLLKERGLWDNATIILTGDHGMPITDPGHPPLLIKLPGQQEGRLVAEEAYTSEFVTWLRGQPEFNAVRPPK